MRIDAQDLAMLRQRWGAPAPPLASHWLPGRRGFVLVVPGRIRNPLSNKMGWQREHRRRKEWHEKVAQDLLTIAYRRGDLDPATPKRVTFRAHVFNRLDRDNLSAALKPLPDALVLVGALSDDRDSAGHVFVYEQQVNRGWRGVEVTVEPLEAVGLTPTRRAGR